MNKKILSLILILSLSSMASANAESLTVQASPDSYGNGYNNVYNDKGAFERTFLFDGLSKSRAFSLDINRSVSMDPNTSYAVTGYDKTSVNNIKKIGYLANNFNSLGNPMDDAKSEAVARQLSIWVLSGGVEIAKIGEKNFPIMKRVEELLNLSKGSEYQFPGLSLNISAKEISKSNNILELLITNNGKALQNGEILIKINNKETQLKIDSNGVARGEVVLQSGNNIIYFKLNYELPPGVALLPPDGGPVITIDKVKGVIDGSIIVTGEGKNVSKIDKIVTTPKKPAKVVIKSKELSSMQVASAIKSKNYKIIDTISSDKFEARHIFDSVNLQLAEELDKLGLQLNNEILIIGDNSEDIINIADYLILNNFTDVTIYKGSYEDLYKVLDKSSYFVNDNVDNLLDPTNDILSFEDEKLESKKTTKSESNVSLFFIGLLLILLSIAAAFLRVRSSKKP